MLQFGLSMTCHWRVGAPESMNISEWVPEQNVLTPSSFYRFQSNSYAWVGRLQQQWRITQLRLCSRLCCTSRLLYENVLQHCCDQRGHMVTHACRLACLSSRFCSRTSYGAQWFVYVYLFQLIPKLSLHCQLQARDWWLLSKRGLRQERLKTESSFLCILTLR